MSEIDLAPLLEYLLGIGWEDLYAPRDAAEKGAGEERSTRTAPGRGGDERGGRAAREATTAAGGGGVSGWAAVRATLRGAPAGAAATPLVSATAPDPTAGDPPSRAGALAAVGAEALACTRCRLAGGRKTVVFGTGDADADLMFIGEGPGAEEDRQGLPFVGAAGQLLDRIIAAIGLERPQVYICNVVKCRPPGNRDPQPDEVAACRGFLESQIRLVRPRVIVALGRVAGQTLLGSDLSVGRLRGTWHEVLGVPVRVTYHPAAILRDGSYRRPTWDDMRLVRDRLTAG